METFYNQTLFIPTIQIEKFKKDVEKLNKKAKKLGFEPISYIQHDEFKKEDYIREVVHQGEIFGSLRKFKMTTQKFTVSGQTPQVKDYIFIASLEATENGNIVKNFIETTQDYSQVVSECQHCKINRKRKKTFILQNKNSAEYIQVGSGCLEDYLGQDSLQQALFQAECLFQLIYVKENYGYNLSDGLFGGSSNFPLEEYLAYVIKSIEEDGWMSRKEASSKIACLPTSERAWMEMSKNQNIPSQDNIDLAEKVIYWAANILEPKNDFERNLNIIAKNGFVTSSQNGFAASMVNSYHSFQEKIIAEKNEKPDTSEYQGVIGEKIEFHGIILKSYAFESFYGLTHLIVIQDDNGNIFKWYATSKQDLIIGNKYNFKGRVKSHEVYKNQKQTVLIRVSYT